MNVFGGIWLVILFAATLNIVAQDGPIKVKTDIVNVPVTVMDRNGRYVSGLEKKDFTLFENGVVQDIEFFSTSSEQLHVLLLLDVSGSMFGNLDELYNAASGFVSQLQPDDQLMIATFNEDVRVIFGFKSVRELNDVDKLKIRLNGLPPVTMVYDAVDFALKKMRKKPGRKAIVLFSDGIGSGLWASAKSNLREASEDEAIVYTVQFTPDEIPQKYRTNEREIERIQALHRVATEFMGNLASVTGGRHIQTENVANLNSIFSAISSELSQQYILGYHPKETGLEMEERGVRVEVSVADTVVHSRRRIVLAPDR